MGYISGVSSFNFTNPLRDQKHDVTEWTMRQEPGPTSSSALLEWYSLELVILSS